MGAGRNRAAFACQPVAQLGAFWQNGTKAYLCISEKRKSAGFSSFAIFGANYLI